MPMPKQNKYAAFISYRHLSPDKEVAQALQKMLEHNMIRPNKSVPRNIRPVFLDTGELPLLEDLDAGILQALENSECLFVICSPNLPLSKYCMREISYFKELHGGSTARIYTLLVDGEPDQSFPEILRTSTRVVRDENGVEHIESSFVEPLFADVRAPTIRKSIQKLRKTEYLRLAAAYYGCTYDSLYKRRKRWLRKVGAGVCAGAAAAVLGFSAYAHIRNLQYNAAQAATYASYARDRNEAGDELLAITLCKDSWDAAVSSGSTQYMTALRSAAVQLDYKLRALPVAQVMQAAYLDAGGQSSYPNNLESVILSQTDYISQITDAKTGEVLQQHPQDSLAILPDRSGYITVSAQPDENGVLWDTVSMWSLSNHRMLNSFRFRPSVREATTYKVGVVVESPNVLVLQGNGVPVAFMDLEGHQLTEEDGITLMIESIQEAAPSEDPFYVAQGNKLLKKSPAVKNKAGETLLTLPGTPEISDFSPDWGTFCYIHDGTLLVYDTASWTLQSSFSVQPDNVDKLHLLPDSSYVLIVYRYNDRPNDTHVIDWRTQEKLAQFSGAAQVYQTEQSFYIMDGGWLTRYHYNGFDLTKTSHIAAQQGSLCLTLSEDQALLVDADTSRVLLAADCPTPYALAENDSKRAQVSGDMNLILLRQTEGLTCYDKTGALLWQTALIDSAPFALARDGQTAAWVDASGDVLVASAADGAILYSIPAANLTAIGKPLQLAVSSEGVCVCSDNLSLGENALWFPQDKQEGILLEGYSAATLYANGLMMLESTSAYVMDFEVWDVKKHSRVYQSGENTGEWCYSEQTGYLVRRVETSNNHSALEMELLQYREGAFVSCGRISLPDLSLSSLRLDSTGTVLSVTAGASTSIYQLPDMTALLETTDCPLYYEGGSFWRRSVLGGQIYSIPLMEGETLRTFAMEAITSPAGVRELSLEERSRFSFDQ